MLRAVRLPIATVHATSRWPDGSADCGQSRGRDGSADGGRSLRNSADGSLLSRPRSGVRASRDSLSGREAPGAMTSAGPWFG